MMSNNKIDEILDEEVEHIKGGLKKSRSRGKRRDTDSSKGCFKIGLMFTFFLFVTIAITGAAIGAFIGLGYKVFRWTSGI